MVKFSDGLHPLTKSENYMLENLQDNLSRYHAKLKNQVNNLDNSTSYQIMAFYKFVTKPIEADDVAKLREVFLDKLKALNIKGTILLASEGINGTISANSLDNLHATLAFINSTTEIGEIPAKDVKYSTALFDPFRKLKVKARAEIVTLGLGKIDVINKTGEHLNAEQWNELIEDPNTIIIDTRNSFEYKMGTFKNSINPDTKTFRELPEYIKNNLDKNKDTKIAMFCTGGVRCEKSTAYLKEQGYTNVYHLQGGILNYFEQTTAENSLWDGRCFIFDDRIAVDQNLNPVGIPEDYINYGRRDLIAKDSEY